MNIDGSDGIHSVHVVNNTQCRNNYEDSDIPSYSGKPLLFICLAYIEIHTHRYVYIYILIAMYVSLFSDKSIFRIITILL